MNDVSPGIAIGTIVGGVFGLLKLVGEILKWRSERRLKRAYRESTPTEPTSAEAPPRLSPVPELSLALKLEAKEVELLRAKYQIDQMQADFRRLRRSLDEAANDQAQLAARLVEQELLNQQLCEEMQELRRQGGETDEAGNRRALGDRVGRRVHDTPIGRSDVRPTRRPKPRKAGER